MRHYALLLGDGHWLAAWPVVASPDLRHALRMDRQRALEAAQRCPGSQIMRVISHGGLTSIERMAA